MIYSMPKVERTSSLHHPVSTAAAAGSGPGVRSSSWSQHDDDTLIKARASGLNWNQISPKHFPQKSANACRKRHERLMEKQNAEQWDGVRLDVLAAAYMEVRAEMWRILGNKVGEKWQLVEQKCMEKGLKNLTQAHRQAQRKQGCYELHQDDSGVAISDLDDDPNENPSPVLTDASTSTQLPLIYQQPTGYATQRVPSIHSILQPPMTHQPMGHHPMAYTSNYGQQH